MIKEIVIDGNNFSTLSEFYEEAEKKLTRGLDWKIGRNLNAFNDVLRGGFGVHQFGGPLKIKWINSDKSKKDLGWAETVKYIREQLTNCHPSNIPSIKKDLKKAENKKGEILFDIIVGIIRSHEHVELKME